MTAYMHKPFDTPEAFYRAVTDLLEHAISAHYDFPAAIMLSGGETPYEAYQRLTERPFPVSPEIHFLLSDERMVPYDDSQSNYGRIRPLMEYLRKENQVITIDTAQSPPEAASRFEQQLEAFFQQGGRIVLGLLGLGTDGHTASLFTPDDLQRAEGRWAVAIPKETGPDRVSVTPHCLSHVDRLIFLVNGESKRPILERFLHGDESLTARRATRDAPAVEVWSV